MSEYSIIILGNWKELKKFRFIERGKGTKNTKELEQFSVQMVNIELIQLHKCQENHYCVSYDKNEDKNAHIHTHTHTAQKNDTEHYSTFLCDCKLHSHIQTKSIVIRPIQRTMRLTMVTTHFYAQFENGGNKINNTLSKALNRYH